MGTRVHLNPAAFVTLLKALGYTVGAHRAAVQSRGRPPVIDARHRPGAGLSMWGWAICPPLPSRCSRAGASGDAHLRDAPSTVQTGGWRLVNDSRATYGGVDFAPEALPTLALFTAPHHDLSPDGASP